MIFGGDGFVCVPGGRGDADDASEAASKAAIAPLMDPEPF